VRHLRIEIDDAIEIAEKIDIRSERRVNAVTVLHTADVVGDTRTVADCVRKRRFFYSSIACAMGKKVTNLPFFLPVRGQRQRSPAIAGAPG